MLAAELKKFSAEVRLAHKTTRAAYPSPGTPVAPPTQTPPERSLFPFRRRLCPLCTAAAEQTFSSDGIESRSLQRCHGRSTARAGRLQQHSTVFAQPFPHGDACGAKKQLRTAGRSASELPTTGVYTLVENMCAMFTRL